MSSMTIFRRRGRLEDVQAELEAAAKGIGAPSAEGVEDALLAAIAVAPKHRRFFVHRAVKDLLQLAANARSDE